MDIDENAREEARRLAYQMGVITRDQVDELIARYEAAKSAGQPVGRSDKDNLWWMCTNDSPEAQSAFVANVLRGTIKIPDELRARFIGSHLERESGVEPKSAYQEHLDAARNANAGSAITVWKNGTWKHWQTLDAKYAEKDPDWLSTIPLSDIEGESP